MSAARRGEAWFGRRDRRGRGASWFMAVPLACAAPALAAPDPVETLATTVCQACHMSDGNSVVPQFPKLAGQQATYLEKQLADFLEGRRRNEVMEPFLSQVKARDIKELAAYYAAQVPGPGVVLDPELAEAGRRIYEDGNEDAGVPGCEACHQLQGEGNVRYPRLAGQHQAYTIQEMLDFRSGQRANDKGGLMRRISERLTDEEIRAVAEYIAGL